MADVGTKPQNSDQLAFDIIWDFDIGIWCLLFPVYPGEYVADHGLQAWSCKGSEMATNVNERTIEVILPSRIGYERIAMASSASFAKMFGFSPARIEDLKTVVAEAAVNAMQHGNKGRPDTRVSILMNLKDDTIYVTVTDDGEGIKKIYPKPDIDRIIDNLDPPIGFGIFLIKQLVDDVDFNIKTEKGNGLRMAIKNSKAI